MYITLNPYQKMKVASKIEKNTVLYSVHKNFAYQNFKSSSKKAQIYISKLCIPSENIENSSFAYHLLP